MTVTQPEPAVDAEPLLRADEISLSFGETPALRRASVSIRRGELLAVMGPSGSGKSTLLHCLAGILVPDRGAVHLGAQRLDSMPDAERCDALDSGSSSSSASSSRSSRPRRTSPSHCCSTALAGARRSVGPGRGSTDSTSAAPSSAVRVPSRAGRRNASALARGLVTNPEVVFADEPTGSLDSLAGEHVMELLVAAARDHGTTVVLVTHDARVAAYADREIVVRDGRVAAHVGLAR